MLLESGDLKEFEIELEDYSMLPVRESAQALIIARQRAERAVLEKDVGEFEFLSNNIKLRLERLVGQIQGRGWLDNVPKQVDLGYAKDTTQVMDLSIRSKLIYLTRDSALVRVDEIVNNFLGFKFTNLDKFHPKDPRQVDWFKTEPVDIYLYGAIPDDKKRSEVLLPWNIPEHVRASLAL